MCLKKAKPKNVIHWKSSFNASVFKIKGVDLISNQDD